MPGTEEHYKLFLRTVTQGEYYTKNTVYLCYPCWKKGLPYFEGFHVWDNRHHRGDGPLFHGISQTPPPSQWITIRGNKYLYIGEIFHNDAKYGACYVYHTNGRVLIKASATYYYEGKDGSIRTRYEYIDAYRADYIGPTNREDRCECIYYTGSGKPQNGTKYSSVYELKGSLLARGFGIDLTKGQKGLTTGLYDALVSPFPGDLFQFSFPHNEWNAYMGWRQLGILPNLYRSGFASAYVDAMNNLPEVRCNMIANVLDIASALRDIKKGNLLDGVKDLIKDPRKAWLSYRYAYSTTKMDVQEVSGVITRLKHLLDAGVDFKTNGTYKRGNQLFRAVATVPLSTVLPDPSFVSKLDKAGLKLSAYNVWDMIPYSFVVDWFLGIGDLLEWAESLNEALEVKPTSVWYSCQTVTDELVIYFRISASGITGTPFYATKNASTKTLLMRLTDALALFS